ADADRIRPVQQLRLRRHQRLTAPQESVVSGGDPEHGSAGSGDLPFLRRLAILAGSGPATLGLLLMLGVLAFIGIYQGPGPAARQDGSTTVILRQGSGVAEIASSIEHEGVIRSATLFIIASRVSGAGHRLKAGEYEFPSRASMASVMQKIRR